MPSCAGSLRDALDAWDEGDEQLASFGAAAKRAGLGLNPLWHRRPRGEVRGAFCHWSADLSIFEVVPSSEAGAL